MTIITHAGDAHRDDFLSVALALAMDLDKNARVFRRDPTEAELDNPAILVLDVGERYEPEKSNFDHHQRDRDEPTECALSLWAQHTKYKDVILTELFEMTLWFRTTVRMDVLGPFTVAREMGITPDQVFSLGSPIERSMLGLFGQATEVSPTFVSVMRDIGKEVLDSLYAQHEGVEKIQDIRQMFNVGGVEVTVLETKDTQGLGTLRRLEGAEGGVGVSHDNRGDGWSLLRFQDDSRIDFSRIKDHPDVLFAHLGGFVAKTKERISTHAFLALIEKALC